MGFEDHLLVLPHGITDPVWQSHIVIGELGPKGDELSHGVAATFGRAFLINRSKGEI